MPNGIGGATLGGVKAGLGESVVSLTLRGVAAPPDRAGLRPGKGGADPGGGLGAANAGGGGGSEL